MKTSFLCKIIVWSDENKARASKTQRVERLTLGADTEEDVLFTLSAAPFTNAATLFTRCTAVRNAFAK
jgi:hypothetical protein